MESASAILAEAVPAVLVRARRGADALAFDRWQRLHAEYAKLSGVEDPTWSSGSRT